MQPGFDSSSRDARKFLNFIDFIALGVVQEDDDAVLVGKLAEGCMERFERLQAAGIVLGGIATRQSFDTVPGHLPIRDDDQSPPCPLPGAVNESVVHDARKPGPRIVERGNDVELVEGANEDILEQVLGIVTITGKPISQPVQTIKVRPQKPLDRELFFALVHRGGSLGVRLRTARTWLASFKNWSARVTCIRYTPEFIMRFSLFAALSQFLFLLPQGLAAQTILIENVRIFDGTGSSPSAGHVLIKDGLIDDVSRSPIERPPGATVISGKGRVLTPGFIDLHSHITGHVPYSLEGRDPVVQGAFAAKVASFYLDHGFTTIRDAGGTTPALARAFDSGEIEGPRLFASGAIISQTAGHGDFRQRHEPHPSLQGASPYMSGRLSVLADGVDQTLAAVRENLKNGATQIKIMGGGGVMSEFDPIHTLQPSPAEIRAAVQAASDWDTYVLAHAYTSEAVTRLVENGVRCIEHGLLIDEATAKLVKDNDVTISTQLVIFRTLGEMPGLTENNRQKAALVLEGQENLIRLIKKYDIRTGFGTDLINSAYKRLPEEFTERGNYWTAAEVLHHATAESAEVIRMSGKLNRQGLFGEIREGWNADLVLFNEDPLEDISVIERPEQSIALVMLDGTIVRDRR